MATSLPESESFLEGAINFYAVDSVLMDRDGESHVLFVGLFAWVLSK